MLALSVLLVSWVLTSASYFNFPDTELTTVVKPKMKDCFYQFFEIRQMIVFEYRVIDAGLSSSDLKISCYVRTPRNDPIMRSERKPSGKLTYQTLEVGDYEFCFDNSFSVLASKTVYFEITLDIDSERSRIDTLNQMRHLKSNDTISLLRKTAKVLKENLEKIKHFQDIFRTVEARDINIQEKNLVKINAFSSFTFIFIMLSGFMQLFILKSMFNPSCFVYRFFKHLCL